MLKPITYKKVLDSEGSLTHIELCQEGRYIKISLAGLGTHKNGYRWLEIREAIDAMQERAQTDSLSASSPFADQWNSFEEGI